MIVSPPQLFLRPTARINGVCHQLSRNVETCWTHDKSAPVFWSTSFKLRPIFDPAIDITLTLTLSFRLMTSVAELTREPVRLET